MTANELSNKIIVVLRDFLPVNGIADFYAKRIESIISGALEEATLNGCLEHSTLFEQAAMKNKSLWEQNQLFKQQVAQARAEGYEAAAKIAESMEQGQMVEDMPNPHDIAKGIRQAAKGLSEPKYCMHGEPSPSECCNGWH